MSSLIAHLAAGATAYACRRSTASPVPDVPVLLACLALAVLPDLDYLLWWAMRIAVEPRITHSLGFAAGSALLAWLLLRGWRTARPRSLALTLLAAAVSHEALDFLVGVHPSPWLWPVDAQPFRSPLGLLPSAGRLDLGNPYLWRNLLIEMGVLGPAMLALCAARRRDVQLPRLAWVALWVVAALALFASLSLRR